MVVIGTVIRMKNTCVLFAVIAIIVAGPATGYGGQIDSLILNHEVSAANFFGTDARAMAMGQTGIAT